MPLDNGSSSDWNDYTLRQVIFWDTKAAIAANSFRLTMAGYSGYTLVCSKVYLQKQATSGDAYDFSTTPVEVKFGGASGFTSSSGDNVVSDPVTLAVTSTDKLLMSAYFTSGADLLPFTSSDYAQGYYKTGNDASTVNATGYSTLGSTGSLCLRIFEYKL